MAHDATNMTLEEAETEITPEMIEAGSLVLLSRSPRYYDEAETTVMIYRAMRRLAWWPSQR
jgi:hypothetical protein